MNVLTVLLDVPYPPESGLHIRQLAILRLVRDLGMSSQVLVFNTAERPEIPPQVYALCDAVHCAGPRVEYTSLTRWQRMRLRGAMLGPAIRRQPSTTYPFSLPYDLAGADHLVIAAAHDSGAQIVILPTILLHLAPRLVDVGVSVVGDAPDIVSQLTRRVLQSARAAPWRLPGLVINHVSTRSQERLFLGCCAEIWASSQSEADDLAISAPAANVVVAGNSIDERAVRLSPIPANGPVGFIGNFTLSPNLAAALFLGEQVLPLIRARRPDTRLALAGAGIPLSAAKRLERIPGIELLGRVENSGAFISSCAVLALAVRLRAGVPLKLIESMACGRPIVASPEIVAGLPLRDGVHLLIADSADETAAAVLAILTDADLATRLAASARKHFESEFSYTASLARLRGRSVLKGT